MQLDYENDLFLLTTRHICHLVKKFVVKLRSQCAALYTAAQLHSQHAQGGGDIRRVQLLQVPAGIQATTVHLQFKDDDFREVFNERE